MHGADGIHTNKKQLKNISQQCGSTIWTRTHCSVGLHCLRCNFTLHDFQDSKNWEQNGLYFVSQAYKSKFVFVFVSWVAINVLQVHGMCSTEHPSIYPWSRSECGYFGYSANSNSSLIK